MTFDLTLVHGGTDSYHQLCRVGRLICCPYSNPLIFIPAVTANRFSEKLLGPPIKNRIGTANLTNSCGLT